MQEYVIELSKYFIAFFMVLYTASCFIPFGIRWEKKHRGVFILQDLLMFLVQVLCFLNLSLVSGDFSVLVFLCIYTDLSVCYDHDGIADLREY